jgi:hypothetical protein
MAFSSERPRRASSRTERWSEASNVEVAGLMRSVQRDTRSFILQYDSPMRVQSFVVLTLLTACGGEVGGPREAPAAGSPDSGAACSGYFLNGDAPIGALDGAIPCSRADASTGATGGLNEPCNPDGTCDPGLSCNVSEVRATNPHQAPSNEMACGQ